MIINLWLLVPLLVGIVLSIVFFGGLWLTVQKTMSSPYVALWFVGSLLLRIVIVLTGFYWACGDDWQYWLAALIGFSVARWVIVRVTRPADVVQESKNAS